MHINKEGWLSDPARNIKKIISPFYNERPERQPINSCVIHNISLPPTQFGSEYVDALFSGKISEHYGKHQFIESLLKAKVSSHFFIGRAGQITQYVSTEKRAWHAGISSFQGIKDCNNYSIGIELNGSDHHPYTLKQYQSLNALLQCLMERYPLISQQQITTHAHIAPGRKTDPGPAFNIGYLFYLLNLVLAR